MKNSIFAGIVALTLTATISAARAADRFWTGGAGDWNSAANWGDKLPGKEDAAKVVRGGTVSLVDNRLQGESVKYLDIGSGEGDRVGAGRVVIGRDARLWVWDWLSGGQQAGSQGELALRDNGVLVANGGINFGSYGGAMKMSVADKASFIINSETVSLAGKGTDFQINGGLVQHNNNRRAFIVGNNDGAQASLELHSGTLETGPMIVGQWREYGAVTGEVMQSGGTFAAGAARRAVGNADNSSVIGDGEKATGTWTTSGGRATFMEDLIVGRGGKGTLNILGGTVGCRKLIIGAGASGEGVVTVIGGILRASEIVGGEGQSSLIIGPQGTLQWMGDMTTMDIGLKNVSVLGKILDKSGKLIPWKSRP